MKYPIGIQSFEKIMEGGFAYVDKTALVYKLVQEGTIYFLSRPRRFGKSLLVSTLENYFLGRKELFKGLAMEELEKDWLEYPVFHLDFNGTNFNEAYELDKTLETFVSTAENRYGKSPFAHTLGDRLADVFEQAYVQTGRRAVVLVDEYDKPLLDVMDTNQPAPVVEGEIKTLEDYNRNVLKAFYSVFKKSDKYLRFVLLTGVTKFSQVSVFSGFNQPKDISLDTRYDALCGITKDEMLNIFHQPIVQLAEKYKVSEQEMVAMLQHKYDGYHFSNSLTGIFNPFSILNVFDSLQFDDYWFKTGTPSYLMRLIANNGVSINELAERYYSTSEFVDYKATKQKPLPMLYQSGYLTIKDYDTRRNTYLLDFPNEEVRSGTLALLSAEYFTDSTQPTTWLLDVTDALEAGDLNAFHLQLKSLLAGISYRFQRKDDARECERHFQYTFYLIMQMLGKYSTYVEKETSQGRIDCVVECPDYVYIFEFKLNSTGRTALKQIDAKGYTQPYAADPRKVYKVGVSFSSKTGTIKDFVYRAETF